MLPEFASEPMIFVDLETTGANFANDRIIEIGVVEVDQDGVREWSSLVNPEVPISPFITGLTGIDTRMVEDAPRFAQIAPQVLEKLRGRLFIAHNARFDYTFLKREFLRLGVSFRAANLCTVKLSRKLFPQHHRHSLDALVGRYDIAVDERHRALADARVLWQLWQRWQPLVAADDFRRTVEAIVGKPQMPPQLDPSLLDDLPEAAGAYAMYDDTGRLLVVKRSANIRRQVCEHFAATQCETALYRKVQRIEWRETAGELGARLGEHALCAAAPKVSRPVTHADDAAVSGSELCSWQLVDHGGGDFRPQLVCACDLDFAVTDNLYGLYANRREATTALRKLAEAQHLCQQHLGLGVAKPGTPCVGYRQRTCRGVCVGKESAALHGARLLAALAKFKILAWSYEGPIALVERDEFGMREDFHVVDRWRYLGTWHRASDVDAYFADLRDQRHDLPPFDAEHYRLLAKFLKSGKMRVYTAYCAQ